MFVALDEQVFVVYIFNDYVVVLLGIDLEDDGFDRGIALDEDACTDQHESALAVRWLVIPPMALGMIAESC